MAGRREKDRGDKGRASRQIEAAPEVSALKRKRASSPRAPSLKAAKARATEAPKNEPFVTERSSDLAYGGGPGAGLTLPPYLKPTPSCTNGTTYFPTSEELGPDEMRISFLGTCPFPPKRNQAATCIMVELGNGSRFFFDFGPGCMRNIVAAQVPLQVINDIFITHLHVDHYGELPYLFCFAPWAGRWKPLRVHGPSGRTPDMGTKAMIKGMQDMTHWHTKAFSVAPVGDGYEVDVNEFPWDDDGGVCYQKDGVTIRHWRRNHNADGATAYRLDWNGLSFVWTGDGRPDDLTAEMAKGVDVFVTELQMDTARIYNLKSGIPESVYNLTLDAVHTDHYATGYMINRVNPRIGMVTHMAYDHDLLPEALAGVRKHWNGLFALGAPDGVVVNVTKEAIWIRDSAMPESANVRRPTTQTEMEQWLGKPLPETLVVPYPAERLIDLIDPVTFSYEVDPRRINPVEVQRELVRTFPEDLSGKEIPIDLLFNAKIAKEAAGQMKDALRTFRDSGAALVAALADKALPDAASAEVRQLIDAILARMQGADAPFDRLQKQLEGGAQEFMQMMQGKPPAPAPDREEGAIADRPSAKAQAEIDTIRARAGVTAAPGPKPDQLRDMLEASLDTAMETLRTAAGIAEIAKAKAVVGQLVAMLGQMPLAGPSTMRAALPAATPAGMTTAVASRLSPSNPQEQLAGQIRDTLAALTGQARQSQRGSVLDAIPATELRERVEGALRSLSGVVPVVEEPHETLSGAFEDIMQALQMARSPADVAGITDLLRRMLATMGPGPAQTSSPLRGLLPPFG